MWADIIITAIISSLSSIVISGVTFWLIAMKNWVTKEEMQKCIDESMKHSAYIEERGTIITRLNNLEDTNDKIGILTSKVIDSLNDFRIELSKLRMILDMWEKKWEGSK